MISVLGVFWTVACGLVDGVRRLGPAMRTAEAWDGDGRSVRIEIERDGVAGPR